VRDEDETREHPYFWSGEGREYPCLCGQKRAENARTLGAEKIENILIFTDGRETEESREHPEL